MVKVFVFGASGFIGSPVAHAFASRGYTVYGLTRSQEKAKHLQQHEITPIVGNAKDVNVWKKYAEDCSIIVESLADHQDYSTGDVVKQALIEIMQKDKSKIVIYTSGVWVFGDTANRVVDETSPLAPPTLVKSRPETEKSYASHGAIILRPGCVYGKAGSLTAFWFQGISSGKPEFSSPSVRFCALVHTEDLAVAYVLAAQKGDSLRGMSLNLVSQNEPVHDILAGIARVTGYKGEIKFVTPTNPFAECLGLNQKFSNQKAKTLLGWQPTHLPFVDDVERYYNAWKAFN